MGVAEKLVLVRWDENIDPYEKELKVINHRAEVAEKGEYQTKLLDPEYKSDGHTEEQALTITAMNTMKSF